MAFEDDLAKHVESIRGRLPYTEDEEAMKRSLIVPLSHVLGYHAWIPPRGAA